MNPLYAELIKTRSALIGSVAVAGAGLFIIQWLPKDPQAYGYRLALTLLFFLCLLTLIGALTKPLSDYLRARATWLFDLGGPQLQHSAKLLAYGLSSYLAGFAYCLMALIVVTMLRVLAAWQELSFLQAFDEFLWLGWWIALLSVPGYFFITLNRLAELRHRQQAVAEQMAVIGFQRPTAGALRQQMSLPHSPPVAATRLNAFHAGGFEWQWSDFFKSAIVFGQTGSGKTVCVLNALLEGLIASADRSLPPAGLILDPKGDFRDKIEILCRRYGRERDLVIIDPQRPSQSARWNPLDSNENALELAARFAAVIEILESKQTQDSYFSDTAQTFLRHAIAFIRASNKAGVPPSFRDILPVALLDDEVVANRGSVIDPADYSGEAAKEFIINSWAGLSDKTRSIVQSVLVNMIDPFLLPPYDTVFGGRSTVSMSDIIETGKILYIYMPIADQERMSRTISTLAKLDFAREVLKRPDKSRQSFFLCDEFQSFFTAGHGKGDSDFFERSRQSNHANLIATQNIPALLKQVKDAHPVDSLLANCATKIFLRNTDHSTNEYGSKLFGERLVQTFGSTRSGLGLGKGGGSTAGSSANSQYELVVRPEDFIRLAQPDREAGVLLAETIVHLASRATVTKEKLNWRVHPIRTTT